jgi:hypothetical protein
MINKKDLFRARREFKRNNQGFGKILLIVSIAFLLMLFLGSCQTIRTEPYKIGRLESPSKAYYRAYNKKSVWPKFLQQ